MMHLRRFAVTAFSSPSEKVNPPSRDSITRLVKAKQWELILSLLSDPSISSQQKENAICLHNDQTGHDTITAALESGASVKVIQLMIEIAPYIITAKDSNGWNLLHSACYYNASPEIVGLIIGKAPPEIWDANDSGMNPLHLACRHNTHIEVAEIIIHEAPVDICASRDAEGWSPLHLVLHLNAAVELIQLIVETIPHDAFFSKNNDGYDPLHYLCEHTEPEKVLQLIRTKSTSVLLEAIQKDSNLLKFASNELRVDDSFAKAAVGSNPLALEFASETVKADRDIVLAAVKKNGAVLQFASEQLRTDENCELAAVLCSPLALEFTSGKTRGDRSIVRDAVTKDGNVLQYAADELRKEKDIILTAVRTTPSSLRFALGGMNQDKECLLATGLWNTSRAGISLLPTIVMSCRLSLDEHCNYHSTLFGIFMKENDFFKKFGIYHQNPWSISSCSPNLMCSDWPCRGTSDTCGMIHEHNGKPEEDRCCWRYNIRRRLEKAKLNGGIVIQVSEWVASARNHLLGPGQQIETEMAIQVGVKIFRVMQNQYADRNPVPFEQQHVSQVEENVVKWHQSGRSDMTLAKVHVV